MKLTDMNLDCIESCLEHLKFNDLLQVAASNKRLNRAANFIYNRKYGSKNKVIIYIVDSTYMTI